MFDEHDDFEIEGLLSEEDLKRLNELDVDTLRPDIPDEEPYLYHGNPDPKGMYYTPHGWLHPQGLYFSAEHGGHSLKAWYIILDQQLKEEFDTYYADLSTKREKRDVAGDFLEQLGWVKLHDPMNGTHVFADVLPGKRLTKRQEETVFDIMVAFQLSHDPVTRKKVDWGK